MSCQEILNYWIKLLHLYQPQGVEFKGILCVF